MVPGEDAIYDKIKQLCYAKQNKEALQMLQQLNINENVPPAEQWKYFELLASCWGGLGDFSKSADFYHKAIHYPGNMPLYVQRRIYSQYLLQLHYVEGLADETLQREHLLYNCLYEKTEHFAAKHPTIHEPQRKIRVGYLLPPHPEHVIYRFMKPLLTKFDASRYEVICYRPANLSLPYGEHTASQPHWVDLSGLGPFDAAKRIYEDKPDILFETEGHTDGGWGLQVAGYKPAPIQVCGIGWFNTTGLKAIDYFLGDVSCDPPVLDSMFCEKILRLTKCHLCYSPSEYFRKYPVQHKPHCGIIYGCFNNFNKITDHMLSLWQRLLQRVPGAKLLLKNAQDDKQAMERMYNRGCELGFTKENLEIRPRTKNYADDYMDVDIALDTFPYPGGGTTYDALYMGVPVVSLYGQRHGSRFGYSILKAVGLAELATQDDEEYVAKAAALAADTALLNFLHHNLQSMLKNSVAMNDEYYVRQVELFYEHIFKKRQASSRTT